MSGTRALALVVAAALVASAAVLAPLELRHVRNDIAVGKRSTELERRAGGAVHIGLNPELLVSLERIVPERSSFEVVTGPRVDPPSPLTLDGIRQLSAYWLLPRRRTGDPATADWIFSYGGDLGSLALSYRRVVSLAPGIELAEVRR